MTSDAAALDFRALLEEERSALSHQLSELGFGEEGETGLSYDSNFADSSQVTAERGETDALVNELRLRLSEVERALQRIEDGRYGFCERCGKPIAPARLEAMPAVTTCIEHASSQR